jgi:hypothetical protein
MGGQGEYVCSLRRTTPLTPAIHVQVIIHSYNEKAQTITGLMHALGVPASSAQVTTYFSGEIVNIAVDGIFTGKWGAKRSADAEYWTKLGPFKGIKKDELMRRSSDLRWLKELCRGWVLMRWKERDFVNVTRESHLLLFFFPFLTLLSRSFRVHPLNCRILPHRARAINRRS